MGKYDNAKIKVFLYMVYSIRENEINDFIKDVEVIDIQIAPLTANGQLPIMVVYRDKNDAYKISSMLEDAT